MDFWVINSNANKATLIIKLSEPLELVTETNYYLQLKYIDSVLQVDNKTESLLSKKLTYKKIDTNTISVDIPANSTVLIGGGSNKMLMADSLTFIQNENRLEYSLESIGKSTKRTKGVFSPIHFMYTLKK
jgi:hypothetical protein